MLKQIILNFISIIYLENLFCKREILSSLGLKSFVMAKE